jgi:hypothetical protein
VLKGRAHGGNEQLDTGFAAFTYNSSAPSNLIDEAQTRPLGRVPLGGAVAELTTGPTWHTVYYWLARDGDGFLPGTDDDLFFAVMLYLSADNVYANAGSYEISVTEEGHCHAADPDATELWRFACSTIDLPQNCTGRCTYSVAQSVELAISGFNHFQLLANIGDVPSRRTHLAVIPSIVHVATWGSVFYTFVDCTGEAGGSAVIDVCGVCNGNNWPPTPALCDLTVGVDGQCVSGYAWNDDHTACLAYCPGAGFEMTESFEDGTFNYVCHCETGSYWDPLAVLITGSCCVSYCPTHHHRFEEVATYEDGTFTFFCDCAMGYGIDPDSLQASISWDERECVMCAQHQEVVHIAIEGSDGFTFQMCECINGYYWAANHTECVEYCPAEHQRFESMGDHYICDCAAGYGIQPDWLESDIRWADAACIQCVPPLQEVRPALLQHTHTAYFPLGSNQ